MRLILAVVLALILVIPATVQADAGHNFGRTMCPQPVPCPDDTDHPVSSADLASRASGCISQYFGYTSPSGFFDTIAGLDGNGCLTPIQDLLPKGMGAPLLQACCIIKQDNGSCAFRCELNATQ